MTAVSFQSAFYLKIYQNNVFLIFKKLFLTSTHQNDLKILKYINLKKKIKFFLKFLKYKNKP
jgi:hypothetical protein